MFVSQFFVSVFCLNDCLSQLSQSQQLFVSIASVSVSVSIASVSISISVSISGYSPRFGLIYGICLKHDTLCVFEVEATPQM